MRLTTSTSTLLVSDDLPGWRRAWCQGHFFKSETAEQARIEKGKFGCPDNTIVRESWKNREALKSQLALKKQSVVWLILSSPRCCV